MSVCGEGQKPNNERETQTILIIELLFARLNLQYVRAKRKKGIAAVALWWSYL